MTDNTAGVKAVKVIYFLHGVPGTYGFYCPGCHCGHEFVIVGDRSKEPVWNWNGSDEKPTVTASILLNKDNPATRCHLNVTAGKIHFHNDCHHALAGQTVPMVDVEEN